jgi:hypothetical protein
MEVGPDIDSPEMAYQVDLLEAFGETEVNIFGVTGTFKDLAGMCPVDLSDPRITLEAKNEFVVKAANEAGLEVEAKYESIFMQIAEKKGLERKFTIAPSEKATAPDKEVITEKAKADDDKTRETKVSEGAADRLDAVQVKLDISSERKQGRQRLTGILALNELALLHKLSETKKMQDSARQIDSAVTASGLKVMPELHNRPTRIETKPKAVKQREAGTVSTGSATISQSRNEASTVKNEHQLLELDTNAEALIVAGETPHIVGPNQFDDAPELLSVLSAAISAKEASDTEEVIDVITEGLVTDNTITDFTENLSYQSPIEQEDLILAWEVELVKEAVDIYDDFTESLSVFTLSFNGDADAYQEYFLAEALSLSEDIQPETPQLVVASVLEGLQEVNESEKEDVALILKEIVGAMYDIHTLEANHAEAELKERAEEQLVELCESLLNRLGVEYDENTLRQFTEVIQNPKFRAILLIDNKEIELDLENVGTREAKHFKKLVSNSLSKASRHLVHALGTFALSYTYNTAAV